MARNYTPKERAAALAALAANGGNLAKTARDCGVPRKTLDDWAKQQQTSASRLKPDSPSPPPSATPPPKKETSATVAEATVAALPTAQRDLASKLEDIAHRIADAIPERIEEAKLQQLTVSLGIAVEKMRLLREQATSIDASRVQLEVDVLLRLSADELLREYRQALAAPATGERRPPPAGPGAGGVQP